MFLIVIFSSSLSCQSKSHIIGTGDRRTNPNETLPREQMEDGRADSMSRTDQSRAAESLGEPGPDQHPQQNNMESMAVETSGRKHFQIQGANYPALSAESKLLPLFLYGFATDPQLERYGGDISRLVTEIDYPVMDKMMIFSSYVTLKKYLSDGVTDSMFKEKDINWLGYNLEADKSPSGEFNNQVTAVIEFAKITKQFDYRFIWGPLRHWIDQLSDQDIRSMCTAGMDGMAIQEQNYVSGDCSNRIGPVNRLVDRLHRICGSDFYITVQILWGQGGTQDSSLCHALVTGIGTNVDSISLWANRQFSGHIDKVFSDNLSFLNKE